MLPTPYPDARPTPRRPGFCFTPEQDRLYEIGWPHLVTLVDGHKDDKKPAASAAKVFKDYFGAYHVAWPRQVAAAFVRACTAVSLDDWSPDSDKALAAMKPTGPITVDEGRAAIERQVGQRWQPHRQPPLVFTIEAFLGTDRTLELLLDRLERDAKNTSFFGLLAGFLLLRASAAVATKARARLEALRDASSLAKEVQGSLHNGIDLALNAVEGARRSLANDHWQYLQWYWFNDDLDLLRARLKNGAKSEWRPNARLVWLCGPGLLDDFLAPKILKGAGKQRGAFLADVGMFRHEAVVTTMVDAIGDKQAGALPLAWLREHAEFARERVERLAKGSSASAEKAKMALEGMKSAVTT